MLLGSPFLSSTAIKVDVGISGGCFRFLDTLGLSSKIALLPFFIPTSPLSPSLVKTCFESTIPEKLQVFSFLRRRCGIAKPNNVVDVSEGDECFKINGIIWWRWCGFLVTVVVGAVVAVVVFWLQFVFLLMTAWSQEMSRLKIAVGAW